MLGSSFVGLVLFANLLAVASELSNENLFSSGRDVGLVNPARFAPKSGF